MWPGDITEPEITGGWMFKEDRLPTGESGFTAGTYGGAFDFEQPFVFEDPDEEDLVAVQAEWIVAYLDELAAALATGQPYDTLIDVDSWIDHHILNTFAKNPDAFRLSGYFHKERSQPLSAGPVWDFDRTMGCEGDTRALDPTWWDPTNETSDCTDMFDHGFWRGLFADPSFRQRWADRLGVLLAGDLSVANVHATIDGMAAELDESADRNFAHWSSYPPRGGSFESEVQLLEDWVSVRHAWMTSCLTQPDPLACTGD
jgi:hypothetical protein